MKRTRVLFHKNVSDLYNHEEKNKHMCTLTKKTANKKMGGEKVHFTINDIVLDSYEGMSSLTTGMTQIKHMHIQFIHFIGNFVSNSILVLITFYSEVVQPLINLLTLENKISYTESDIDRSHFMIFMRMSKHYYIFSLLRHKVTFFFFFGPWPYTIYVNDST